MGDFFDSVKRYLLDRISSPYFASVILCWIIAQRRVVFIIFSFTDDTSINDRVKIVEPLIWKYSFWCIHGFWAGIVEALVCGLFVMIGFSFLKSGSIFLYDLAERCGEWLLRKLPWRKFVPVKELEGITEQYLRTQKLYDEQVKKAISLEQEKNANLQEFNVKNEQANTRYHEIESRFNTYVTSNQHFSHILEQICNRFIYNVSIAKIAGNNIADILPGAWKFVSVKPSGEPESQNTLTAGHILKIGVGDYGTSLLKVDSEKRIVEFEYFSNSGSFRGNFILYQVSQDAFVGTEQQAGEPVKFVMFYRKRS